jgi:hypothetical protein
MNVKATCSGNTYEMLTEMAFAVTSFLHGIELKRSDGTPFTDEEAIVEFGQRLILYAGELSKAVNNK